MLYGNPSIAHYTKSNVALWMAMAFQAGSLNIGGFMACGRFVSHVTGFAGYFGYEIARTNGWAALGMLAVPLFFLLGGMISGQLVDVRLKSARDPRYYLAFGVIFALIAAVYVGGNNGFFGPFGAFAFSDASSRSYLEKSYLLLGCLSLACGIQNGTVTSVSKSVIRTTHLSGITTDLGLSLTRLLHRELFREHLVNETRASLMRVGIIVFFLFGSAVGALAFRAFQFGGFLIPLATSGLLFALMLYFQLFKRRLGSRRRSSKI